jgi:hypothetical protein
LNKKNNLAHIPVTNGDVVQDYSYYDFWCLGDHIKRPLLPAYSSVDGFDEPLRAAAL